MPTTPDSMLEPEFAEPYNSWKATPTPATSGQLLTAVNPVLDSAIKTYVGKNASPTLRSRAKLMALDAFQRYDPTRAKLQTHLMSHLRGLRRVTAQERQIIHIPERVGLDLYHLRGAESELQDRLGRSPSTTELADHTGLSTKRIEYVRKAQPGMPEGLTHPTGEEEESASSGPAVMQPNQQTWLHFVHGDLNPTDQLIMEHSLGLFGQRRLSKQRIAAKLRLSPGAISQRSARIQEKIDSGSELWPLR